MGLSPRFLDEGDLLAQCRVEFMRGSGPGGQKRNKTDSAVRLTHLPSGVSAVASDSRSRVENNLFAMRRLRLKLAAQLREPLDLARFEPPDWFLPLRRGQTIDVSHRHPHYAAVGGLLLDLLSELSGNPTAVALNLGISTSSVVKFLHRETIFWSTATQIRQQNGLAPLKSP